MGASNLIEAVGLGKVYGSRRAVADLSFSLAPGEILGLLGPNGAGKTTTLRCLAGILPPTSGAVRIGGRDLATDAVAAKRALAFIPDEPKLFDYLTVREHLILVARLYGVGGWEEKVAALLRQLGLADKQAALPEELSRGMRQKLLVACAFLHDPAVILLDEPLTGLDPLAIRQMKQALRARAEAGAALVLSSTCCRSWRSCATGCWSCTPAAAWPSGPSVKSASGWRPGRGTARWRTCSCA